MSTEVSLADDDEAAFVERYWTETWRDRHTPPDAAGVAAREEYGLMAPYLSRLDAGSRILDGGCGLGEWTVYLAGRGFDVTGLDISRQTIARLQARFPGHRFAAGDLRGTSFADGSFDAYFSWGTFEHFEQGLGACVSEARRLIRPGGWLFVTVPYQNWQWTIRDIPLPNAAAAPRFYQWRLTRRELRRELELHGFRVDRISATAKLTGAGRLIRGMLPGLRRGSQAYNAACRALAGVLPARLIGHMIFAAAERR